MAGITYTFLFELAADQFGYFTAAQARERGIAPNTLVMMARRNTLERLSHGVYRLVLFPISPLGQYVEATFWPGGTRGVISHQSALALYGVSDVSPARIHLCVPSGYRTHRHPPKHLQLHRANLAPGELDMVEGIPVTTLERAITDCARAHLGRELIEQAIEEGRQLGRLSRRIAEKLSTQLLAA